MSLRSNLSFVHLTPLHCRKVTYLLNELGLDYETKYMNSQEGEHKKPEFLAINPNGRMPALVDHKNNDYTIWFVPVTYSSSVVSVSLTALDLQGVRCNPDLYRREVRH